MTKKAAGGPAKKKAATTKKPIATPPSTRPPDWPALHPLPPHESLSLDTILTDQVILIRKLLPASLCQRYVAFLASLPLTTTTPGGGRPKKGEARRVNDRFQVDDAAFAARLWSETGLQRLLADDASGEQQQQQQQRWGGEVCGLNPRIRVYRYAKGQFFDRHYDESNLLTLPTDPPTPAKTTWTLLIYLTRCVGGETAFYPEFGQARHLFNQKTQGIDPIVVGLEEGMALLHKHGEDCLLHEGREVVEGEKWVIRSDLCVKR